MGPQPETCTELLRPLRALLGLKQVALQHTKPNDPLPYAAAGLLGELVHCGESRASDLAQHRVVDASVVSRQVAQLEQAQLISRRPDPADKRVSLLHATPEGERALAEIEQRRAEWLGHVLRDWDDTQVRSLAEMLGTVVEDVRRAVQEKPERSGPETTEGVR